MTGDFSRIVSAFKRFLSPSPVRLVPEKIYDFIVRYFLGDIVTHKIWGWTNGGSFELEAKEIKAR